ncbi:transposable element Tcb2 transposase [Trichonephila clavipes]|nr:transposable element Tcb2 transposase [Trichonephila clavipes]
MPQLVQDHSVASRRRLSASTVRRRLHNSDESRFTLESDSGCLLIWRERSTRYHQSSTAERHSYRGGGIMVWAGISLCGHTGLHVFQGGTLTGVAALIPPPRSFGVLEQSLLSVWSSLPISVTDNLIDKAWRVVGRLEGDQTQAEVAQAIGVSQSVISRIWNRFLETGSAGRRPGQGCRWATTPNEDRYLVLTARRHRNMNATLLQQHLRSATGTTARRNRNMNATLLQQHLRSATGTTVSTQTAPAPWWVCMLADRWYETSSRTQGSGQQSIELEEK